MNQNNKKLINIGLIFIVGLYLFYFIFWWTFKLSIIPGLHGDEAWVGLQALHFKRDHLDRLSGMNHYTGILQPYLSSVVFSLIGEGVFQLRVIGPIFNFLGLIIIILIFRSTRYYHATAIFLLITGQSVLLLISPRIAWEVNSFTLFFIALLLLSLYMIQVKNRFIVQNIGYFLFLITNIIGTYNHVIFSCISMAGLMGLVIWSIQNKSLRHKNLLVLSLINAFNLVLLFYIMQHDTDQLLSIRGYVTALIFALILAEIYFLFFLIKIRINDVPFKISKVMTIVLFVACFNSFAYFHGIAFFQLLTSSKVLLHFFSYQTSLFQNILYLIGGCTYLLVLILFLAEDITTPTKSIYSWVIISYLGLFSLYTINCSFRYYLSIFILCTIYIAFKFNERAKGRYLFLGLMLLLTVCVNQNLFEIFIDDNRAITPVYFNMGNGQMETSAHFLPNKPVVDFLIQRRASKVSYGSNQFFLKEPVDFFYAIKPWPKLANSSATIDYDFQNAGRCYRLF